MSNDLTEEQIADLRASFDMFDKDGGGEKAIHFEDSIHTTFLTKVTTLLQSFNR